MIAMEVIEYVVEGSYSGKMWCFWYGFYLVDMNRLS